MLGAGGHLANVSKSALVSRLLSEASNGGKLGKVNSYLSICEYCRASYVLGTPSKITASPLFCVSCGKTSPNRAFQHNLGRTSLLIAIASKMKKKLEMPSKSVLLEQALVTTITSFEILLRDVYSLILDHRHVIYGESIYSRIYDSTRNEFLGLGAANSKFKREVGLNIKARLGHSNYAFLSRMYSARHIIVHNCSIIDKDFISQTGADPKFLKKRLSITLSDLRKLLSVAKRVGAMADRALLNCILEYKDKQTDITIRLLKPMRKSIKQLRVKHRCEGL
jgi:hypothetical protein